MDFADLLKRVRRPSTPAAERPASATASPAFWEAFRRRERTTPSAGEATEATTQPLPTAAPFARQGSARPPSAAPARPAPSVEPADIARELGLSRLSSIRALQRLRRDFALTNHPDRVPSTLRTRATQRMMIANALIDAAMKRFGLGAALDRRS